MPASSSKTHAAQEPFTSARQSRIRSAGSHQPGEQLMVPVRSMQQVFGNRALQRMLEPQLQRMRVGHEEVVSPAVPPAFTGSLPSQIKTGVEALSGVAMDSVKVHYNSPEPALVQALAYTQGTEIHVAPGQEKHLAHEAWHVVQQQQGRVRPTMQLAGTAINDDSSLEREADSMGAKADLVGQGQMSPPETRPLAAKLSPCQRVVQRNNGDDEMDVDSYDDRGMEVDDDRGRFGEEPEMDYYDGHGSDYELTAGVDESDHPEGDPDREEIIDWSDLTGEGLRELHDATDERGAPVLFNIFVNLAFDHYDRSGEPRPPEDLLLRPFSDWLRGGVYTRGRFKNLIGLDGSQDDRNQDFIQRKRSGNTYSWNTGYKGASNKKPYDNVIYLRDGKGNIDFTENPKNNLRGFNSTEGSSILAKNIKWTDPQDHNSRVKLQGKVKGSNKGVMPSGKSVVIPKASRAQHFAIADSMYQNQRSGTWTWHHLTKQYEMVLVDMKVHSKHGHNGGFLLWK